MARFLFTVWPLVGHYFPAIAMAETLRARGHDVAFYTGRKACPILEKEGFLCFPFRAVDEQAIDRILNAPQRYLSWKRPFQLMAAYQAWLLGTVPDQVSDLEEIIATWHPATLVCDVNMFGPILVLHERCHIPVAALSAVVGSMLPGPEAPLTGLGLPPSHTWYSRQRACVINAIKNRVVTGFRHSADALRQRYDLPTLPSSVLEFTARMPLYMVRGTPEIDYNRHDLPASAHYVGPLLWSPPADEQPQPWLTELPEDRPWILVSGSTMGTGRQLILEAAAQGLENLPVQVIITAGSQAEAVQRDLGAVAPNVTITNWVSHSYVLPRTAAVVTLGGAGTVLSALNAGIPVVVVPAEADQPDTARRVVETGVGLQVPKRKCSAVELRRAVERLLSDAHYRQHAQQLAEGFKAYGGATRAADLVTNLAKG